ncbi:serine/threonine-protein kinase [Chondromyces apiculatus]|uniref:Protein kinase domain-containing protein n=1 Tax=Chondromyces apiculatus DSM 436 TaxID=1192034 RepID=A0A017T4Q1_9BACT|nr:serine/threonine-protein kinase [Chondromyces apiculatus]EYF03977.1 Hypothetical protein CAP_5078 [Chondromyces apiculatus DSM 436]
MTLDSTFRTTTVQAFAHTVQASEVESGTARIEHPTVSLKSSGSGSGSGSGPTSSSARGPSVLPESGHLVGGLYRLIRLLGQGMFGKVYVAQRIDVPEHQVALKLLPRSHYASRNVERELVMLATVGHPNVVQLKDHGMTADYVWLTMSVYDGETLEQRLKRGPLGMREAYEVFLPVARGLEALHAAGLRHQDVKPDNLFLARFSGRVHPVLLDLGVAAEREATFCAGTALYASPEQLHALNAYPGAVTLDEKMDTYCLAATLLTALVGPAFFPGEEARSRPQLEEALKTRAEKPLAERSLPDLTGRPREQLEEAFRRWLALDSAQRPSMSQMADELEVLLEPEREAARKEEARLARQRTSLTRLRIAAGALLLIGAAAALLVFSKRETLRVAGELERATRLGQESFSKLDTCVASHRIAEQRGADCQRAREQDRQEHKQTMLAFERSGSSTAAEQLREIQNLQNLHATRLKACEDEAEEAATAAAAEQDRQSDAWEQERAALVAERDTARTLAEERATQLATLTEEKKTCDAERATLTAERERNQPPSPSSTGVSPASLPSTGTTTTPQTTASPAPPLPPPEPSPSEPPSNTLPKDPNPLALP